MKAILILAISLLLIAVVCPPGVTAQPVTGPNQLGVFFDEAGTVNAFYTMDATEIHAYLVLLNPTESSAIVEWRSAVVMNLFDPTETYSRIIGETRFGVNIWSPLPGDINYAAGFSVIIDADSPQPLGPATVLADITIQPIGDYSSKLFYITRAINYYRTIDDVIVECYPASGDLYAPVAAINAEAPVENLPTSWGSVKSLFR